MFYKVRARCREEKLAEFRHKLTDGTIAAQRPDGQEIVASMHRARITAPGAIEWSEMCFCPTPLRHERETVYDHFFSDLETRVVDGYVEFEGEPFMAWLARRVGSSARPSGDGLTSRGEI